MPKNMIAKREVQPFLSDTPKKSKYFGDTFD